MSRSEPPPTGQPGGAAWQLWLRRLVAVEADELSALAWSFTYFFCLLCSYYILRPLRDEMGILGGVENLHWLFTGTFLAMLALVPLFGWVTSRYPRRRFLPYVYAFFVANILVFYALFDGDLGQVQLARAFFIWVSVFNLFVVSVFWSFMADVFDSERAKRLFGFIAAGGSAGALVGPALTTLLAEPLGARHLLPISAALLLAALLCVRRLAAWQARTAGTAAAAAAEQAPLGGGLLAGIRLVFTSPYLLGVSALILLYTTLATFLYFQQAHIVRDHFADSAQRTAVFAAIDLAVNSLTILCQLFLTGRVVRRLGLGWTLAAVPLALAAGFALLAAAPVFAVLVVVQVLRRAGNYALMRPGREMLFTVLGREEKYKAKNFIDTTIYRGGDAVSAWAYAGLGAVGLELAGIALLSVPLALAWAALGYVLGRHRETLAGSGELSRSQLEATT